jgi:hypothetical protein
MFKIIMSRHVSQTNAEAYVSIWKEKANEKLAYEYGIERGTEIFGGPPSSVTVIENEPVV